MEPAYVSAFAALAGSAIGGLTSLGASWLTQYLQFSVQLRAGSRNKREELYRTFIEEASRLFVDACEQDTASVSNFVNLYALISRMRVLSSREVVVQADKVVRAIIETYQAPKKSLRDVAKLLDNEAINPLRDFGNACRDELRGSDGS